MCVKPDGTLSPSAEAVLKVCVKPATLEEITQSTGIRTFRLRSSIRELIIAGILEQQDDRFGLTPAGMALLKGQEG